MNRFLDVRPFTSFFSLLPRINQIPEPHQAAGLILEVGIPISTATTILQAFVVALSNDHASIQSKTQRIRKLEPSNSQKTIFSLAIQCQISGTPTAPVKASPFLVRFRLESSQAFAYWCLVNFTDAISTTRAIVIA